MSETWRAVPGYEGAYEVSDLGRVRSLDRLDRCGKRRHGRLLRPISMPSGYLVVNLWCNNKSRTWLIHRLVLMAFVGEPPKSHEALHRNGDNSDNRFANLAWGTHSQNQWDQVAHGTHSNASKTHCTQGHPFTESNTYWYPGKPHRACRICRREWARALLHRRLNAQTAKESA